MAEQQITLLREGEEDLEYGEGNDKSPTQEIVIGDGRYGGGNGGGLIRRGAGSSGNRRYDTTKVLSDLEKYGVKPGAGVSKAVTWLDSLALFFGRYHSFHCFSL